MDCESTDSMKTQWVETFRLEVEDLLAEIEEAVLDLEQYPDNQDSVHRLFRAMHTIKGSGAMFGFESISKLAHHVETVLNGVREGDVGVTGDLIYLVLLSRDRLKTMLDGKDGDESDAFDFGDIVTALHRLMPESMNAGAVSKEDWESYSPYGKENVYAIRFQPNPDIMSSGMDPSILLGELRELGECRITPLADEVPLLEELRPDNCYLGWDIILKTRYGMKAVQDVFIFVVGDSQVEIREIEGPQSGDNLDEAAKLGTPVEKGDARPEIPDKALAKRKRLGETGPVSSEHVESALAEQETCRDLKTGISTENIRVSSDKLDTLINLVGELLINQSRLARAARFVRNTEMDDPLATLNRLAADLRDCALDMRMMPVGTLFGKFRRLVRDLSVELGKEITFVTEGEETEMDKTVIERMSDSLVHLIRNSIDHGIQFPCERESQGKSRKGTIRLAAKHKGSRVEISVSDDGMGINVESVRAKAVEKGLIPRDAVLNESEIPDLIFSPGFSTSDNVTAVSGRGVGMDVVKRAINGLGGSIIIESEKGAGTAIRLSLPLTLAIIEGLLVNVAGRQFVLPLEHVEECCEIDRKRFDKTHGRNVIPFRGELLPFVCVGRMLGLPAEDHPVEQLVIAQTGDFRVGLVVDSVVCKIQTVIKSLGKIYGKAEGFSGATIMGDGKVALIVDVPGLIEQTRRDEENFSTAVA